MKRYLYAILLFLFCINSIIGQIKRPPIPGYVDLDLPSGTLWKEYNEGGFGLYTYDDAVRQFGKSIPSFEQIIELKSECTWVWNADGYIPGYDVIGKNGNSIFLPASGIRDCNGNLKKYKEEGNYMCLNPAQPKYTSGFSFTPNGGWGGYMSRQCCAISVRLVK